MAVLQLWETLKLAITAYTGLSPATFFTILAVAFAFCHVLLGMFSSPVIPPRRAVEEEDREPLPPPVQLGEITEEELRAYDGSDPKKPLLMAIKGQIYDVSQSRDASRALAKMSFEENDLTGDIEDLVPSELDALQDWEYKFMGKYAKVGTIKKNTAPMTESSDTDLATNSTARSTTAETVEAPSGNVKPKDGASTTDEAQG